MSSFKLELLPYSYDALEPVVSARTMRLHHDVHLGGYVRKLNEMCAKDPRVNDGGRMKLAEVVMAYRPSGVVSSVSPAGVFFETAAQVWNHVFFFNGLRPFREGGGPRLTIEMRDQVARRFGSFDKFVDRFADAGTSVFGSGWVWLVVSGGKLDIFPTKDADLPMAHGKDALFCVDVWEHAYYLDYEDRRRLYVERVLLSVANWKVVEERLMGMRTS